MLPWCEIPNCYAASCVTVLHRENIPIFWKMSCIEKTHFGVLISYQCFKYIWTCHDSLLHEKVKKTSMWEKEGISILNWYSAKSFQRLFKILVMFCVRCRPSEFIFKNYAVEIYRREKLESIIIETVLCTYQFIADVLFLYLLTHIFLLFHMFIPMYS